MLDQVGLPAVIVEVEANLRLSGVTVYVRGREINHMRTPKRAGNRTTLRNNNCVSVLPRPVDRRALLFTPLGLGGPMEPRTAQELAERNSAQLALTPPVPETVRDQFSRVLQLYADGVFTYANYTSASRESHRVLEVALKVRFLEHYRSGVPLLVKGTEELVLPQRFEDVRQRLLMKARLRDHGHFNGSFASLLSWARREGYFFGQRNRIREQMTWRIRNEEIHSEFDHVLMPPDAVRRLQIASELIARLWGADRALGIAYPGTIEREVMVVGQGPREHEGTRFLLEQLPSLTKEEAGDCTWYVVLCSLEEDFFWWQPDLETTATPVTRLWGPGSWEELAATAALYGPAWHPDSVPTLDRTFYMRVVGGVLEPARSAAQVLALRGSIPDERWCAVRADAPAAARTHVHRMLTGECTPHGCACAATLVFERARRETVVQHARVQV